MKTTQTYLMKLIVAVALLAAASIKSQIVSTPVSSGGNSASASSPNSIPLMSVGMLRAYALTIVDEEQGSVNGHSVSGDKTHFRVGYPYKDANPGHMAAVASSQVIKFTADPTEKLSSSLYYLSVNLIPNWTFTVFWGDTEFNLVKVGDRYHVPAEAYRFGLRLSDSIPVRVPNIRSAYILEEDAQGNVIDYYDFSWDRRIHPEYDLLILGRQLVNQKGKLYIVRDDNSKLVFNLKEEGQHVPLVAQEANGFRPTIDGVRTVPVDTGDIVFHEGDELVYASYTGKGIISVQFPAMLARYPVAVYAVDAAVYAANPLNTRWEKFSTSQPVNIPVVSPSILIRFEYDDPSPELPNYPNNGGEKNGGGVG